MTIYDNTHFDLEVVSPITSPINPVGIATGFTNPIYGSKLDINWSSYNWELESLILCLKKVNIIFLPLIMCSNYIAYDNITKDTVKGWIEGTEPQCLTKYTICNNIQILIDEASDNTSQSLKPNSW